MRDALVAWRREDRLPRRRSRRLGRGRTRRSARLGVFDIRLDDTAVRTGALHAREIDPLLRRDTFSERRSEDALTFRSGSWLQRWSGCRLGGGRRSWRCGRSRCRSCFRFGGHRWDGRTGRHRCLALFQKHGDHGVHLHAFGAFGHHDLANFALVDSFDFHRGLVGLDLANDLAGLHRVPDLDVPLGELALRHGGRQRRHQDIDRHDRPPRGQRLQTARAASTILSACGNAIFSRLAA